MATRAPSVLKAHSAQNAHQASHLVFALLCRITQPISQVARQQVQRGSEQPESWVSACPAQKVVKSPVDLFERIGVPFPLELRETIGKSSQVGVGCPLCGARGHVGRDRFPQFQKGHQIGVHELQD